MSNSQPTAPSPKQSAEPSTEQAIAQFRDLLKKVGSGTHTSKSLSREEAAIATHLMLTQAATPAQIGAFMIAHRIKRPTPTELAGMLDTYDALGPRLKAIESPYRVTIFCNPYDGRSRTAPIHPLTALIMACADAPVIIPGSGRMPTKMGLPAVEIFQGLDLNWSALSLAQLQTVFAQTHLALVYQPSQFPLAEGLVPYREQIGKRPTFATVEIMWSPYAGRSNLVSGYVHPPTEERTQNAFTQRNTPFFTTVKGLEGSCDISRARTAILGLHELKNGTLETERLLLHPRDYGFDGPDLELMSTEALLKDYREAIAGKPNEIARSAIWNSGFYLWRAGRVKSIEAGFELGRSLLETQAVARKLNSLKATINTATASE